VCLSGPLFFLVGGIFPPAQKVHPGRASNFSSAKAWPLAGWGVKHWSWPPQGFPTAGHVRIIPFPPPPPFDLVMWSSPPVQIAVVSGARSSSFPLLSSRRSPFHSQNSSCWSFVRASPCSKISGSLSPLPPRSSPFFFHVWQAA